MNNDAGRVLFLPKRMRDQDGFTIIALIALIASGLVLVIVAAGVFLLASPPENLEPEKIPFDRAQWLQGDDRTRGMMVDDLIDRELLKGMDAGKVQEYLGPPLETDDVSATYLVDIGHIFWDEPWPYILVVDFDEKTGEVKDVFITD